MMTNFDNCFTDAFSDILHREVEWKLSPVFKCVAALPCWNWMLNSATLWHVIQCKYDA